MISQSFFAALLFAGTVCAAAAATIVPPGNRSADQPGVPGASTKRTNAGRTTFEAKYQKIYRLLRRDEALRAKIAAAAAQYAIEPIHIVGAIVGEHTYNVDAYDRLQTYYVKAVAYLKSDVSFSYRGEDVTDFVQRPQFAACSGITGSYELWTCRELVWDQVFRGRNVDGTDFPDDRFSATFFQPFYAGQTFGLGQLNPLTALQISDLVHTVSGLARLDAERPSQVYETIMDPDLTLPYVAATIRNAIDAYLTIAGFDISQNPGITATLYNVGNPEARATALRAENEMRLSEGLEGRLPEENYYGWLINEKLPELRTLF
ncbi:MAG: hypothetical protein K0S21_188 [Rhizobiaceae bacterium]|jgi:hypothetical protein|nr:hypothetical protein [Rhizobiaceae bacterium]